MADGAVAPGGFGGYRAFLSYSHKDAGWGAKLHRRLESYRFPKRLAGSETARGVVPDRLAPVFRDREELSAGESLSDTIKAALAASDSLIVLCSPHAKASPWVAKEIALFRELHPDRPVLAALIAGEPGEAFPEGLYRILPGTGRGTSKAGRGADAGLSANGPSAAKPPVPLHHASHGPPLRSGEDQILEPIAADFRKGQDGERLALLKLAAGMTGVPLDALVQRDAQRQMRRVTAVTSLALAAVLVMAMLTTFAFRAQAEAERQRAEAEGLVEYMLTDLRDRLKGVGRLDVMTAVNERAMRYYGEQGDLSRLPAESLERRARILHAMGEDDDKRGNRQLAREKFAEAHRTTAVVVTSKPNDENAIFAHAQSEYWVGYAALYADDDAAALRHFKGYQRLARRLVSLAPSNPAWQRESAYAEGNLCSTYLEEPSEPLLALPSCNAALDRMRKAAALNPADTDAALSVPNRHGWLAEAFASAGRLTEALDERRRQREAALAGLRSSPDDARWQDAAMAALLSSGEISMRAGRRAEGLRYLGKAEALAQRRLNGDPQNERTRKFLLKIGKTMTANGGAK